MVVFSDRSVLGVGVHLVQVVVLVLTQLGVHFVPVVVVVFFSGHSALVGLRMLRPNTEPES